MGRVGFWKEKMFWKEEVRIRCKKKKKKKVFYDWKDKICKQMSLREIYLKVWRQQGSVQVMYHKTTMPALILSTSVLGNNCQPRKRTMLTSVPGPVPAWNRDATEIFRRTPVGGRELAKTSRQIYSKNFPPIQDLISGRPLLPQICWCQAS